MSMILPAAPGAAPHAESPDINSAGLDELAAELHERAKAAGVDPTALLEALSRHTYGDRHDRPDEETVQVDDDVAELLDRYPLPPRQNRLLGGFLTAKSNPNTRVAYLGDVEQFLTWLLDEQGHCDLARVRRQTATAYAAWLERKEYSPKTRARRISTMSAVWAADDPDVPLLGRTPWARLSKGAVTQSVTRHVPLHRVGHVIDAADRNGHTTGLLIRLLLWCGLRVHEACGIRLSDVDDSGDGTVIDVRTKGGRSRRIHLPAETCAVLALWLAERAELGTGAAELLVNADGEPLGRHPASWLVAKVTRSALGEPYTPHCLRKTGAVILWRAGTKPDGSPVSFEDLRRHGGWESLETVRTYVRAAEEAGESPSLWLEELSERFRTDQADDRRLDDDTRRALAEQVKAATEAAKAPRRQALTASI